MAHRFYCHVCMRPAEFVPVWYDVALDCPSCIHHQYLPCDTEAMLGQTVYRQQALRNNNVRWVPLSEAPESPMMFTIRPKPIRKVKAM